MPTLDKTNNQSSINWNQIIVALLGLVGAVTIGWWQFGNQTSPTPKEPYSYFGHVIDNKTKRGIKDAKVILDGKQGSPIIFTDSEGVFRFQASQSEVLIRVEATGYQIYSRRVSLAGTPKNEAEDIRLNSN